VIDLNSSFASYRETGNIDNLLGVIRSYALRRSKDEDIAQDVCIKVWEKITQYDPERGSFAAWVSVICRNSMTDGKRRALKLVPVEDEMLEIPSSDPKRATSDRLQKIISDDIAPELVELLLAGHSPRSAGRLLNLSQGQITNRLKAIRKNILGETSKKSSPARITY
jgi:RNA polymerase sigma factor (sigma-70 family)